MSDPPPADTPPVPPLDEGEVLLHRIPPRGKSGKKKRAAFGSPVKARELRPRLNRDHGLSCSRLRLTSPADLLRAVSDHEDADLWTVCALRVADVLSVVDPEDPDGGRLRVVVKPEPHDPGHVEIVGPGDRPCPYELVPREALAGLARILSDEEVQNLRAGDPPPADLR